MALIQCPDCGKEVSSSATACPNCGYPITSQSDKGFVTIKFPAQIEGVRDKIFGTRTAVISGGASWVGAYGSIARFEVSGPTKIWIDLGKSVGLFDCTVFPGCRYRVESYTGRWGIIKFELVEF